MLLLCVGCVCLPLINEHDDDDELDTIVIASRVASVGIHCELYMHIISIYRSSGGEMGKNVGRVGGRREGGEKVRDKEL